MFSFGSAEKGQLGNGTTGERITTGNKTAYDIEVTPGRMLIGYSIMFSRLLILVSITVYIKELDGKNIVNIVSGPQHSLAIDDTGLVKVSSPLLVCY